MCIRDRAKRNCINGINKVWEACSNMEQYVPVSYTHLDVYKRQAFNMVKKLLALNNRNPKEPNVEVILLSRNSADTGLRVFNSIKHHGMNISRAAFTRGKSTFPYASAFGAHLFLSADVDDVRESLDSGLAAATILPSNIRTCLLYTSRCV